MIKSRRDKVDRAFVMHIQYKKYIQNFTWKGFGGEENIKMGLDLSGCG
jgi:hypothetical protein